MYSITDRKSFESTKFEMNSVGISYWIKSLDDNCKEGISKILVGNKMDLEDMRQVKYEEGKSVADKNGMQFYETSAKAGTGIEDVFLGVAKDIIQKHPNIVVESNVKMLSAANVDKNSSSCC